LIEVYRVRRRFGWDGWEFAPAQCTDDCKQDTACEAIGCTQQPGTDCACKDTICRCTCGVAGDRFGGEFWFVNAGDVRKEFILGRRLAVYDAGIESAEVLLKAYPDQYEKLLAERKDLIPA
tara:strand:- start:282 stop:644 length:363 start_codon:yes stop_codon:yes gene_type:complete